jgi:hypothetical protein
MLVQDLKQNAHFVKAAAKRDERFYLLVLIGILMGRKHRQKGLLCSPETVGGSLSQNSQLGHQVVMLSLLSELLQLPELAAIFHG